MVPCGVSQPEYRDDLDASFIEAWRLLAEGAAQRKSAFHLPVLATVDSDGAPDARALVLRGADMAARTLRFHTDARSPKLAHIRADPRIAITAYCADAKVQLRLTGHAAPGDAATNAAAWAASSRFARRCYMAIAAPGAAAATPTSGLPAAVEGREPDEAELADAAAHFATIIATIDRIDWLWLANGGHRRAQFRWQDGGGAGWAGAWVVP